MSHSLRSRLAVTHGARTRKQLPSQKGKAKAVADGKGLSEKTALGGAGGPWKEGKGSLPLPGLQAQQAEAAQSARPRSPRQRLGQRKDGCLQVQGLQDHLLIVFIIVTACGC